MAPTKSNDNEFNIPAFGSKTISLTIIGRSPLIYNRVTEKARRELLLPPPKKTASQKESSLKHDPLREFHASPYTTRDASAPTLLVVPAEMFKGAMANAALDIPNAAVTKAKVGRLIWVEGEGVPIYGIPKIFSAIVRNSDPAHTPDVRTRCIVPQWAAEIVVSYTTPLITAKHVVDLATFAGQVCGIGDWRPQKGKGSYGQFAPTDPDRDLLWNRIVSEGGRSAQIAAMERAEPYNEDTEELLSWFDEEVSSRGMDQLLEGANTDEDEEDAA